MATDEEKWYFTKEQLLATPSRRFSYDADRELSCRQQAANFIQDMGQRLQVTQLCINTAIVYMHRFYVFHSFSQFHRNAIAAASLFLAAKVEEQPRKLEHVIRVAQMCLHRDQPHSLDTKSEYYMEQSQDLVVNENVLLQTLGFDVAIDHPHTHVVRCCHLVRASKDLAQTSYFMASNSLHLTTMCLQYKPTVVACFCIHLACKWSNWEIPQSNEGKSWFYYVDRSVTQELLEQLTAEFLVIFDKCPSRLKRKVMAISANQNPNILGGFNFDEQQQRQTDAPPSSHPSVTFAPGQSTLANRPISDEVANNPKMPDEFKKILAGAAHHREAHGREAHGREAHGREAHGREAHGREAHGREAHGREAPSTSGYMRPFSMASTSSSSSSLVPVQKHSRPLLSVESHYVHPPPTPFMGRPMKVDAPHQMKPMLPQVHHPRPRHSGGTGYEQYLLPKQEIKPLQPMEVKHYHPYHHSVPHTSTSTITSNFINSGQKKAIDPFLDRHVAHSNENMMFPKSRDRDRYREQERESERARELEKLRIHDRELNRELELGRSHDLERNVPRDKFKLDRAKVKPEHDRMGYGLERHLEKPRLKVECATSKLENGRENETKAQTITSTATMKEELTCAQSTNNTNNNKIPIMFNRSILKVNQPPPTKAQVPAGLVKTVPTVPQMAVPLNVDISPQDMKPPETQTRLVISPSAPSLKTTRHRSSSSSSEAELVPVMPKLEEMSGFESIAKAEGQTIKLNTTGPDTFFVEVTGSLSVQHPAKQSKSPDAEEPVMPMPTADIPPKEGREHKKKKKHKEKDKHKSKKEKHKHKERNKDQEQSSSHRVVDPIRITIPKERLLLSDFNLFKAKSLARVQNPSTYTPEPPSGGLKIKIPKERIAPSTGLKIKIRKDVLTQSMASKSCSFTEPLPSSSKKRSYSISKEDALHSTKSARTNGADHHEGAEVM